MDKSYKKQNRIKSNEAQKRGESNLRFDCSETEKKNPTPENANRAPRKTFIQMNIATKTREEKRKPPTHLE